MNDQKKKETKPIVVINRSKTSLKSKIKNVAISLANQAIFLLKNLQVPIVTEIAWSDKIVHKTRLFSKEILSQFSLMQAFRLL